MKNTLFITEYQQGHAPLFFETSQVAFFVAVVFVLAHLIVKLMLLSKLYQGTKCGSEIFSSVIILCSFHLFRAVSKFKEQRIKMT